MDTKIKFNHPVIKCGIWEDDFPDNIKKDLWYVGLHATVYLDEEEEDEQVDELELFVCIGGNTHGFQSYGWEDRFKIILKTEAAIVDLPLLVDTAHKMAVGLNNGVSTPVILCQYHEVEGSKEDY